MTARQSIPAVEGMGHSTFAESAEDFCLRSKIFQWQNHCFIRCSIQNWDNLKKQETLFFKFTKMQSVILLSTFDHLCVLMAWLCFFCFLLQFQSIFLTFQSILWPVSQNSLKSRNIWWTFQASCSLLNFTHLSATTFLYNSIIKKGVNHLKNVGLHSWGSETRKYSLCFTPKYPQ